MKARKVAVIALAGGLVLSVSAPATLTGQGAADSLAPVEARAPRGILYLTGGAGVGERKELLAAAGEAYNLHLVFALRQGKYLSGVEVAIVDSKQEEVLAVTSEGPWLFAALSPGPYVVHATMYGETITRKIQVRGEERTMVQLLW